MPVSEVQRSIRFWRIDSAASAWRMGPEMMPAIWNAEAVAEFKRRRSNDDLLVFQLVKSGRVAAEHVDIGDTRDGGRPNAEIDQERRPPVGVLPGQHDGHRRHQGIAELLAERIAANQPVGFDRDIDQRRPRLVAERLQGTIDMSCAAIRRRLLEGRQDGRAADLTQRRDEGFVGGRVRRRAEVDVEGDVLRPRGL